MNSPKSPQEKAALLKVLRLPKEQRERLARIELLRRGLDPNQNPKPQGDKPR